MTRLDRPFIHLNFALDATGRMGTGDGKSLPISSAADWRRVHGLRERYQAVAVGARTWLADRPRLTARASRLGREPRWQPDRVVFNGGHECPIPPDSRQTFVVGRRAPEVEGVLFAYTPGWELPAPLALLARQGIRSMLVEGGATLLDSFLEQGCFDRVTIFVRTDDEDGAEALARKRVPALPPMVVEGRAEGVLLGWRRPIEGASWERGNGRPRVSAAGSAGGNGGGESTSSAPRPASLARNSLGERAMARLPTRHGDFEMWAYEAADGTGQPIALVLGDPALAADDVPLVRLHSECLTGDALGSLRCDCGPQLDLALGRIAEHGHGVLLYLRQEGRGIGLFNKVRAYALQERGLDTVEANVHLGFPPDLRDYSFAARALHDLGVWNVRLLTNNPRKVEALEQHGVRVIERVPLTITPGLSNEVYLRTKRDKMGHLLPPMG